MEWETLILNLLGGVSFFLYGMQLLTDSMKLVLGDRFKHWLTQLTSNRVSGLILGAALTIACQSSSITTVLTIGLVSADIMPFEHSIGVTLGANIGSTVTGQLISFSITKYYTAIVFVAGVMLSLGSGSSRATGAKAARLRSLSLFGSTLMGLAFIFLGMEVLSVGAKALKNEPSFTDALARLENRGVAMLVGLGITAVIQSSGMMSAIIITLANQGLIPLEVGMAIMVGANVGSCVPAMLACMNQNRVAQQTALAHLMFNVILVVVWTPLLPFMIDFVKLFPPHVDAAIEGEQAKRETEYPRQIANSHTFDNLAIVLLLLPITKQFAQFIQWMRPLEPKEPPSKAVAEGDIGTSPSGAGGKLSADDEEKLWQSETTGDTNLLVSESSTLPDLHPRYLNDSYLESVSIELGLHVLVREMERFVLRIGDAFQLCTQSLLHAYVHAQMEQEEMQAQKRMNSSGTGSEVVTTPLRRSVSRSGKRDRSSSKDGWSAVFASHAGRQLAAYSTWASDLWRYLAAIRSFHSSLVGSFGLLTEMQTSQLVRWGSLLQSLESAVQTIHQLLQSAHFIQSSPSQASNATSPAVDVKSPPTASMNDPSHSASVSSMIPASLYDLVGIVSQSWKDVAELLEVQVQEGIKKHKKKSSPASTAESTARVSESTQTDSSTGVALTQVSVEVPSIDSTSPASRILAATAAVSRLVKATSAACSSISSEGDKPLYPFPVRVARSLKSFYFSAWHIANTLGMSNEMSIQSFDMWEQRDADAVQVPSNRIKSPFPQVVNAVIAANKLDKENQRRKTAEAQQLQTRSDAEMELQQMNSNANTVTLSTSESATASTQLCSIDTIQLTPIQHMATLPIVVATASDADLISTIALRDSTSPSQPIDASPKPAHDEVSNVTFHINESEYSSNTEIVAGN